MLLSILRRFGLHLVLHGHKHNPHVFTEDSRSAFLTSEQNPILVAAGGSAGSTELPTSPPGGNTYNQITIKWLPDPAHTRIRVVTRGLKTRNDDESPLVARLVVGTRSKTTTGSSSERTACRRPSP